MPVQNTRSSPHKASTAVALPHIGLPASAPELSDTSNATAAIHNVQTPPMQDKSHSDGKFFCLFTSTRETQIVPHVSQSPIEPTPHAADDA